MTNRTPPAIHFALDTLEAFETGQKDFAAKELCEMLNIPLSTQYRVLQALESRGYLRKIRETGRYTLGFKLLQIGTIALQQDKIVEASRGVLQAMCDETLETIQLGVLEDLDIFFMQTIESPLPLRYAVRPGMRAPSYCVAAGKAILAYETDDRIGKVIAAGLQPHTEHTITNAEDFRRELAAIRKQGYALNRGELSDSGRGVFAPVFDYSGKVAAAVGVSVPPDRFSQERIPALARTVMEGAKSLSSRLGADLSKIPTSVAEPT